MRSLYRKYRPLKLADVVGQAQVTEPLSNALKAKKISHAYLFTGPRGTGKTSVARIFAHEVNGFDYALEDDYTDIIEIDGASNRGVDNIREIREKVAIAPTEGKYKVYIIDEVHMLTKEAFNALLKTLEEPPEHVIFIMATTDAYKVPVTITSRAQTYTFKLADAEVIFGHLKKICEKEKIKIDDAALRLIVRRGGGSFRDSLSLLDQISTLSDDLISKEMVEKVMGLPEDEKIVGILDGFISGDVVKITTVLKDLYNSGVKAEIIAEELISRIIDEPKHETLKLLEKLPEVKAPFGEAKLLCAIASEAALLGTDRSSGNHLHPSMGSEPRNVIRRTAGGTALRANPSGSSGIYVSGSPNLEILTDRDDSPSNAFDWQGFLDKVKVANDAVFAQLKDARWKVEGNKLSIEPAKSFAKVILKKPNNLKILIDAAGKEVTIGENDNSTEESALKTKISDIMGGEVQEYGGGNPF